MITLLSTPRKYQPAYGNCVIQFSSTAQTAYFKYRYVVDVVVENQIITRLKITPQNNSWGQCDISEIIRNYINSNPINMGCSGNTPINTCKWGWLDEDIKPLDVYIGEEYATTANGDTLIYDGNGNVGDPAVTLGGDVRYIFNGVKEWFDGKYYDTSPFYLNSALPTTPEPWDTHRYLTNAPRVQYIQEGEYSTLAALNPTNVPDQSITGESGSYTSNAVFSAKFEFYDVNDNIISSARTYNTVDNCGWRINCTGATATLPIQQDYQKKYITYLGTGPANLDEHGITYSSNTKYYRVCLEKSVGSAPEIGCLPSSQISEWFYYYFPEECSSTNIRLMFQNKLGTYDYYTFKGAEDLGYNVNRQIYTEAPELYVDGWDENTYYGWNYTNKVWNNPQSKSGILRSGYISKADAIWLSEELSRSPRVYVIYPDGDIEPIIPRNTEVVIPNPKRPGQIELILEYNGGYKELRQNN